MSSLSNVSWDTVNIAVLAAGVAFGDVRTWLNDLDFSKFMLITFDESIKYPKFSVKETLKHMVAKAREDKSTHSDYDVHTGTWVEMAGRNAFKDACFLIRIFCIRGSNIPKISSSLAGQDKLWFDQTITAYGIKRNVAGNAKAVTLARLAQALPHVTTYFFKTEVARTFGDFPAGYPAMMKNTVLYVTLLKNFYSFKYQSSHNMATNISNLKTIVHKLKVSQHVIYDKMVKARILTILPPEYSMFIVA